VERNRTLIVVLWLIAFGLFLNAGLYLVRPALTVEAQAGSLFETHMTEIALSLEHQALVLETIEHRIDSIQDGSCGNVKLCGKATPTVVPYGIK
jgi:hypothetical protein